MTFCPECGQEMPGMIRSDEPVPSTCCPVCGQGVVMKVFNGIFDNRRKGRRECWKDGKIVWWSASGLLKFSAQPWGFYPDKPQTNTKLTYDRPIP